MYLRELTNKDAPLMLEWMHDESVVAHMGTNFAAKTLEDCQRFIHGSSTDKQNFHLAVADDRDEYMGTVSLKHMDQEHRTAEFAITVRSCAMGKGYSSFGMKKILDKGICELGLDAIYWCVSPENCRAVRFYDKCGYQRVTSVPGHISEPYPADMPLYWYVYTGSTTIVAE